MDLIYDSHLLLNVAALRQRFIVHRYFLAEYNLVSSHMTFDHVTEFTLFMFQLVICFAIEVMHIRTCADIGYVETIRFVIQTTDLAFICDRDRRDVLFILIHQRSIVLTVFARYRSTLKLTAIFQHTSFRTWYPTKFWKFHHARARIVSDTNNLCRCIRLLAAVLAFEFWISSFLLKEVLKCRIYFTASIHQSL